jgi:hypothetical protein
VQVQRRRLEVAVPHELAYRLDVRAAA